jgi:hypothetical protein
MKTSPKQISIFTEDESIYSPEGFRANLTVQQVNALVKKMTDTSGQKCLEQFERLNPDMLWQKMFLDSLVGMEGWYSTRCKLTWKLKGTKFNQLYFQLVPSTLPIEEIEYGLLHTPRANKVNGLNLNSENLANRNKGNLEEVIAGWVTGLIQTPTAIERSETPEKMRARAKEKGYKNGTKYSSLKSQILYDPKMQKFLPTPNASDNRNRENPNDPCIKKRIANGKQVGLTMMVDGQLNPQFVAEMMGFPTNWTELPFLNGDKNQ